MASENPTTKTAVIKIYPDETGHVVSVHDSDEAAWREVIRRCDGALPPMSEDQKPRRLNHQLKAYRSVRRD